MNPEQDKADDKSDLETALEHVAVTPPLDEPEIAADDIGATALAEAAQKRADEPAGGDRSVSSDQPLAR